MDYDTDSTFKEVVRVLRHEIRDRAILGYRAKLMSRPRPPIDGPTLPETRIADIAKPRSPENSPATTRPLKGAALL